MSVIDRLPAGGAPSGAPTPEGALLARLGYDVVLPNDHRYDAARQAWNLAADQRPAAVVLPRSVDQVVAAVEIAARHGLRVAPQATGHGAASLGDLAGTILLRTDALRRVEIDAEQRRARVEAGALWADVAEAAGEHGLAGLAGSSPDVGVVGYTLGGGLSWLGRRHGLAANSVLAVELVTADGRVRRVDDDHDADLFWAIRGGGGSFGVVTAIEFRLYPVAEVYAGWLMWPMERAPEVLRAYAAWAAGAPDEVTAVGRLLQVPPLPDVPEPLRGRSFVVVEAAHLGDHADADELLRPLRELGPELDTFGPLPASRLHELHRDPTQPVPGAGDGMLIAMLPDEAVDALVAVAGPGSGSPLLSLELRQLGGALGRPAPGAGALPLLDAAFALFAVGIAPTPEAKAAVHGTVERVQEALAPWAASGGFLNFRERPGAVEQAFDDSTHRRLREIKARYDAAGVLRANHAVGPA